MFALLLQNDEYMKGFAWENKIITVMFLQATYLFYIISDKSKEWERKVNEKHERMNKVLR